MKRVFISDLHLSDNTNTKNQLLFQLLQYLQDKIDELYILGDFFEYWCGDDDDNAFIQEIKLHLKNFKRPIYFIKGNHDFAIGHKFAQATGIKLIADMSVINTDTQRILLSHGDDFCTLDVHYHKMKKIIGHPVCLWILLHLPLSWRYWVKNKLQHKSELQFNTLAQHIYQVVDQTIINFADKNKVKIVIHGHTHHPGIYTIDTPKHTILRYEIPDWADHQPGGYILLDGDKFSVEQFMGSVTH